MLRNEDLTETVRDFVDDEIDALVEPAPGPESPHDWDFDGLSHELTQMGLTRRRTSTRTTLADIGVREDIARASARRRR